jgi:predicted Zn-dependent peptidase
MTTSEGHGSPQGAETPPPGVEVTRLASGTRVVTERMPAVRSVAVGFWIAAGSRHEDAPVAGASHFLEHLLFKGTPKRSAQDIAESIDRVGGDMNAFTAKEYTCFYARCLDRDLGLAIDILGDMIVSSLMTPQDVDAERSVVLEEIGMHLDTPDDLVHSMFSEAVFGNHPLAREVLGDKDTITKMGRDDVYGYYRSQYTPGNLVVAVAGNVEHEQVVALVEDALGDWHAEEPQTPADVAPYQERRRHVLRTKPTEQVHVLLGGPGLRRTDERRHAANVLNQALGGGMASRLFQEVRERRGLAYSVYSYLSMYAEAGSFGVYAGSAPDRTMQVLDVVGAELERVAECGLTEEELVRSQGSLSGSLVLALEDTGSRMVRLGRMLTTGTPLLGLDELMAAVDAVEGDDVREVAQELLARPRTIAVVGPVEQPEIERMAQHPAVVEVVA